MNRKDYYSSTQVMYIFNLAWRQQLKRFKEKYNLGHSFKFGKVYYYDKTVVDALASSIHGAFEHSLRKLTDTKLFCPDINFNKYVTFSRLNVEDTYTVYSLKEQFIKPQIRTIECDGQTLFNIEDVKKEYERKE